MNKIQRVSFFFRVIFQIVFLTLPLIFIAAWLTSTGSILLLNGAIDLSFIPHAYTSQGGIGGIMHELTYSERVLGFLVSGIPVAIYLFITYSLIKLFKLYEQGEIFSLNNVSYIRKIGFALLLTEMVNPFYQAAMGVILTWHNPPGYRFAEVTLNQTNVGITLMAILVILISWIMAEGCKLREEQQLTI